MTLLVEIAAVLYPYHRILESEMDSIITGILLSAATIIALLILFMTFEAGFLKRLAILALILLLTPLLIAIAGNIMGWFDIYTIEIITLRQGALSVIAATSYGLITGVILNSIKLYLLNTFRKMRG